MNEVRITPKQSSVLVNLGNAHEGPLPARPRGGTAKCAASVPRWELEKVDRGSTTAELRSRRKRNSRQWDPFLPRGFSFHYRRGRKKANKLNGTQTHWGGNRTWSSETPSHGGWAPGGPGMRPHFTSSRPATASATWAAGAQAPDRADVTLSGAECHPRPQLSPRVFHT